jgi:hypothetical protein
MANTKVKEATYADIEALPEHITGEIIFGVLETQPRPAERHVAAVGGMTGVLTPPFGFGSGGPGGWIILPEPELHLGPHVLVPDLAGWRRERLLNRKDRGWFDEVPDWVCEVLSPSTRTRDLGDKRRIYGTYEVGFLWIIDPAGFTLEVFIRQDQDWLLKHTFTRDEMVCAPPFEAITFSLGLLWPFDTPSSSKEA